MSAVALIETRCWWCGCQPCICPRREPCACGETIVARSGRPGDVREAVAEHNETERHRRWREEVEHE